MIFGLVRLVFSFILGTTLVECKSGYGLDLDNEIKMLKVIEKARRKKKIDISSTYCGAHAVPKYETSQRASNKALSTLLFHVHSADICS